MGPVKSLSTHSKDITMGYNPATDDGPRVLSTAEIAHYLSRAFIVLDETVAANPEFKAPESVRRLWAHLITLTIAQGRLWVKREREANAALLGVREPNVTRALRPLVSAGLIDYTPGAQAKGEWAGAISTFEISLEGLGYYEAEDETEDEGGHCPTCACFVREETDFSLDDYSGLPDEDDEDEDDAPNWGPPPPIPAPTLPLPSDEPDGLTAAEERARHDAAYVARLRAARR